MRNKVWLARRHLPLPLGVLYAGLFALRGFTRLRSAGDARALPFADRFVDVAVSGLVLNFVPDLDVDTNPDNPIIGSRSFGRTPELVIDR